MIAPRAEGFGWRRGLHAARRTFWRAAHQLEGEAAPHLLEVRSLEAQGAAGPLPARLYVPFAAGAPSPLIVFFHGGGFVTGDLDSHDMMCRRLADASRARVLSIAYRLAPAHKFPAAPDDCEAAVRWASAHARTLQADPGRLAVAGDSAGGALAAATALSLRAAGPELRAMALLYPCVQLVGAAPVRLPGAQPVAEAALAWVREAYLPDPALASDPRCSPLFAPDLSRLPPTLVVTAGFDPLADEGRAFADRLAAQGVSATVRHHAREPHGFCNFTMVSPAARVALSEIGGWLAGRLEADRPRR